MVMRAWNRLSLSNQVFIGLLAGIAFGFVFPRGGVALKPVGDLFLNLIRMIILPLILTAIVAAVAQLRDIRRVGRVGVIALVITMVLNFLGAFYSLLFGFLTNPAAGVTLPQAQAPKSAGPVSALDIIMGVVPNNVFGSLARGDILPLIFFSILLGLAIVSLKEKGAALENFFASARDAVFVIVGWVMKTAPYGVFGLVASTVGSQGSQVLMALLRLLVLIWVCFIIWLLVFQSALVKLFLKLDVIGFYRAMSEVALIGFTTCSSAATVPINMKHTHERLGVSKPIADFVVGLATTTTGRAGACIYNGMAIAFVAGLYNVEFSFTQIVTTSFFLMLIYLGSTGIPGGGTIMLTIVLESVSLPLAPIALIMGIDRLRDMITTMVNVLLQATIAAMSAVFVGEKLTLHVAGREESAAQES
jgi:Na+/H+-dicarboxylate symporter